MDSMRCRAERSPDREAGRGADRSFCWDVHLTSILPLSYQAHDHVRLWVNTCQFPDPRIFREIGHTDTPGVCIKKPNPAVPAVHGVEGVQAVADYIETELSPEEVLDAMASVILSRNRHSNWTLKKEFCILGMGHAELCHCHCRCLSLLMIVIINNYYYILVLKKHCYKVIFDHCCSWWWWWWWW